MTPIRKAVDKVAGSSMLEINPRPVQAFLITRTVRGVGGDTTPPSDSKLRVVELRGKDQPLGLDEYSRLLVSFFTLGQYLTQLWRVKGRISAFFGKIKVFQL